MVVAAADLWCHVVDSADTRRLGAMPRNRDELAQPVVADLDVTVFVEDVPRLHVPMDNSTLVQVPQPLGQLANEERRLLRSEPMRLGDQQITQRRPLHILHHDEVLALGVLLDIEYRHQVRAFEVHAMGDAAQLDRGVVAQILQRDLTPAVADRVIDLSEPHPGRRHAESAGAFYFEGLCKKTYSIVDEAEPLGVKIQPNPSGSVVNFDVTSDEQGEYTIEIYSVNGTKIYSEKYYNPTMEAFNINRKVDLENISNGVYTLIVTSNYQKVVKPLLIFKISIG